MSLKYLTMPKWGIEMQKGTLSEWHVKEGDAVEKGQLLALVETDKITNELEASQAGLVHKLVVGEGEEHVVGQLLAVLGDAGETPEAVAAFLAEFVAADTSVAAGGASAPEKPESKPEAKPESKAESKTKSAPLAPAVFEGLNISPAAKTLAIELAIDPRAIAGTGRKGRISLQDVEQAAIAAGVSQPKSGEGEALSNAPTITEMSSLQKAAAKHLSRAKATIPHFYLRLNVNLEPLLARKKELAAAGVKASLNDLLIKLSALALKESPDVNVQLHGEAIHKFAHADIAVAVATDYGLVTPVVKLADTLELPDISAAMGALADKARNKKLSREDLAPGTFTLSNLGMFGIESFDAIINPPSCAILAVGASRREWGETEAGGAFQTRLTLSLSCDHRAIDGATGATFLKTLKQKIENPKTLS